MTSKQIQATKHLHISRNSPCPFPSCFHCCLTARWTRKSTASGPNLVSCGHPLAGLVSRKLTAGSGREKSWLRGVVAAVGAILVLLLAVPLGGLVGSNLTVAPPGAGSGWEKSWQAGTTPWDMGDVTPVLAQMIAKGEVPSGRALVPGCGSVSGGCSACQFVRLAFQSSQGRAWHGLWE